MSKKQNAPGRQSNDPRPQYAEAVEALNAGDWRKAQTLSMDLVRRVPDHGGVYFVAGVAARELLQVPLAIQCLGRAVDLNPKRADYAAQLARALSQASLPRQSIEVADKAVALSPTDAMTYDTLGVVYSQANAYEKAMQMFQRLVELQPGHPNHRFNLATSLIHSGDMAAAERELDECVRITPGFWKAHLTLAQLRKHTASNNHLERLGEMLAAAGDDTEAQLFLNLAMAKEYEDLEDYTRAFEHLQAGKSAGGRGRGYTSAHDAGLFGAVEQEFPGPRQGDGESDTSEPIFVFGMPRTGTTLVERILSSHPEVYAAGELQGFGVALKRASGSITPPLFDMDMIQRAKNIDWDGLATEYIDSTRPATGHLPHFVDKLPHNFLFAGYIANALPDAKLICVRRDPMDTCLSNFRQLFSENSRGHDYSYDLLDVGRYYVQFDRLMAFWNRQFPGRILEVKYESVVDDLEANARRLLDSCGLSWDDACLDFQNNAAPVATASAVQVREPIYRSAIQRWKRYETELGPLRKLLVDSGIRVDD